MILGGATYIMTNRYNTVLYTGSTRDLLSRTLQHKNHEYPKAFTVKYNCGKLAFWKAFQSYSEAKEYEYYIKGKSRKWKLDLIESFNPN
jgi:putative endonuclease